MSALGAPSRSPILAQVCAAMVPAQSTKVATMEIESQMTVALRAVRSRTASAARKAQPRARQTARCARSLHRHDTATLVTRMAAAPRVPGQLPSYTFRPVSIRARRLACIQTPARCAKRATPYVRRARGQRVPLASAVILAQAVRSWSAVNASQSAPTGTLSPAKIRPTTAVQRAILLASPAPTPPHRHVARAIRAHRSSTLTPSYLVWARASLRARLASLWTAGTPAPCATSAAPLAAAQTLRNA